jgi:hypothetical protein
MHHIACITSERYLCSDNLREEIQLGIWNYIMSENRVIPWQIDTILH